MLAPGAVMTAMVATVMAPRMASSRSSQFSAVGAEAFKFDLLDLTRRSNH